MAPQNYPSILHALGSAERDTQVRLVERQRRKRHVNYSSTSNSYTVLPDVTACLLSFYPGPTVPILKAAV